MTREEKIHHSEETIKKVQQENPFQHSNIKKFYKRHQGDDPNSFIQTHFCYLDYHLAIYGLLLFLDRYGDEPLPIGSTDKHTTLREHTLSVAEIMLHSLKKRDHIRHVPNISVIWGGLAALSCNLGAGLGAGYCEPFKDQGQASLALLEQMPEVSSLHCFKDIKEIIRLFSIYSKTSITHARNHLEKDNFISDLTKMLVAADLQVKRREIFSVAEKPAGFRLAGAKGRKEGMDAAAFAREAERERQELKINLEEEFEQKREAYVGEIRGLRNSRDQLTAELKIKNKLIEALKKKDKEAVKLAEEELQELRKSTPKKDKEKTTEQAQ